VRHVPLITGGTGFAGSHLIEHLLEREERVAAWSHPGGKAAPRTDPRVLWRAVDLLDRHAVARAIAQLQPSAVYHCGGIADVSGTWSRPERALQVNALGTYHLLEAIQRAALECPVLVTGSALVYKPSREPLTEQSPACPSSPYGLSKLAQEMVAAKSALPRVLLARPFNHAGPRQSDAYVTSSFARQIAEAEAGVRDPVLHVGNLESRRDITDVRDTVAAYRLLVEHGHARRPYNVCSGHAYRIRELLGSLVGMARVNLRIENDSTRMRPSDDPIVLGDGTRLRNETGWSPRIPIERTLADLLDYWRSKIAPA
jgi:GDP-4-dehydro-6-deoxy-D-mannose reductase